MKTLDNVTLKWLDGDDLDQLEPILAEKGWMSLNKVLSRALCAFDDDDKLIAFFVFQALPHAEPLWVEKEWRASGLAEQLADEMHEFLSSVKCRGFMLIADDPVVAKMAEAHGMKKIQSPVYIKIDVGEGV